MYKASSRPISVFVSLKKKTTRFGLKTATTPSPRETMARVHALRPKRRRREEQRCTAHLLVSMAVSDSCLGTKDGVARQNPSHGSLYLCVDYRLPSSVTVPESLRYLERVRSSLASARKGIRARAHQFTSGTVVANGGARILQQNIPR